MTDDLTDMGVCGLRILKERAQEQLEAIDRLDPVAVFGFALGEEDPILRLDYWKCKKKKDLNMKRL
jgi:hypothetical protein